MFRHSQRLMPHVRALFHRFGALHRVSGGIFGFSAAIFGFCSKYSPILEFAFGIARAFGVGLDEVFTFHAA